MSIHPSHTFFFEFHLNHKPLLNREKEVPHEFLDQSKAEYTVQTEKAPHLREKPE